MTSKYNDKKNIFYNDYINLDDILNGLWRRKKYLLFFGVTSFVLVFGSTIFNRLFNPVYLGSFTLLINDPLNLPEKKLYSPDDKDLFEKLATNTTDNDIPTLIEFLRSPLLIKPLAKKYNYSEIKLIRNINVSSGVAFSKKSSEKAEGILKIELLSQNPKKDINLLFDLSKIYLQTSLSQRQQRLKDGLEFLDQQEPVLQKKNNLLQSELVNFREKFFLIEPESEGKSLKFQESKLKEELSKISSERNRLKIVRNEVLEGSLSATGFVDEISSSESNKNLGLRIKDYDQSLLNQIFTLENEISKKRTIFKENSKTLKKLKENLDELKPALQKSQLKAIDTALRLNSAKEKDLNKKLKNLQKIFSRKPELIKEYNALKQKLEISQRKLFGLISARENFQLKIAQSSVPWKIIQDPTIDTIPIKPSIANGFLTAIVSGIFFGIFFAIFRDKLDFVFHNKKEIEDFVNSSIIGEVPFNRLLAKVEDKNISILEKLDINLENLSSEDKNFLKKESFSFQEAFTNIYSSINYLKNQKKLKTITITSSLYSEGKSLINIMLAKTIANLGRKVLLIDANLRNPQINFKLALDNKKGLTNFLIEKNIDYKELIHNVKGVRNLKVITSGPKNIESTKILNSKKMKTFLKTISESQDFDFILINSSQIIGISDSLINSELIDGYILVISMNRISKNVVLEAVKKIISSNSYLLGVLPNNLGKYEKLEYFPGKYGYGYSDDEYPISNFNSEKNSKDNEKITKNDGDNILEEEMNSNSFLKPIYFVNFMAAISNPILHVLKNKMKILLIWLDKY